MDSCEENWTGEVKRGQVWTWVDRSKQDWTCLDRCGEVCLYQTGVLGLVLIFYLVSFRVFSAFTLPKNFLSQALRCFRLFNIFRLLFFVQFISFSMFFFLPLFSCFLIFYQLSPLHLFCFFIYSTKPLLFPFLTVISFFHSRFLLVSFYTCSWNTPFFSPYFSLYCSCHVFLSSSPNFLHLILNIFFSHFHIFLQFFVLSFHIAALLQYFSPFLPFPHIYFPISSFLHFHLSHISFVLFFLFLDQL